MGMNSQPKIPTYTRVDAIAVYALPGVVGKVIEGITCLSRLAPIVNGDTCIQNSILTGILVVLAIAESVTAYATERGGRDEFVCRICNALYAGPA